MFVAPRATTHGSDATQRVVTLEVQGYPPGRHRVSPRLRTRGIAPPGYYMLFVLHKGVPSVASWVQLTADALDATP